MDTTELIDAQFEKAVSIVQSLPKTGPIQTGYEEKLAMYRYVCEVFSRSPRFMRLNFEVCINKVSRIFSLSHLAAHSMFSDCWKCEITSTWSLGYAGKGKVVSEILDRVLIS